jgi:hypothetical protein
MSILTRKEILLLPLMAGALVSLLPAFLLRF